MFLYSNLIIHIFIDCAHLILIKIGEDVTLQCHNGSISCDLHVGARKLLKFPGQPAYADVIVVSLSLREF